jgi:hypothetical protein
VLDTYVRKYGNNDFKTGFAKVRGMWWVQTVKEPGIAVRCFFEHNDVTWFRVMGQILTFHESLEFLSLFVVPGFYLLSPL